MDDPAHFAPAAELDRLAEALGDPTRRSIYRFVAQAPRPLTAADVGAEFGIHRTVARAHLERLVDGGLLSADFLRRAEGGRPPKIYVRSDRRLELQLPARQYMALAEVLLRTLERFGEAGPVLVEREGMAFGRHLAETAPDLSLDTRVAVLRAAGAEPEVSSEGDIVTLRLGNCLYRELSGERPDLVCALDRAVVQGLLSAGDHHYRLVDATRRTAEHDVCSLVFLAAGDHPISTGDQTACADDQSISTAATAHEGGAQ
jgi:predicted ArsR family transcriptional regulator